MLRVILLLFIFALLFFPPFSFSSLYLKTFNDEQGLSQNSITCSINDKLGFYWFATQSGLNRFDGYSFKSFRPDPNLNSISGNWVTDCLTHDEAYIWFATASNGLNLFNTQTSQFQHYSSGTHLAIANNQIWSLAKDSRNNLWLGHDEGKLTRLNHKEQSVQIFSLESSKYKKVLFRDMIIDKKDNIWLASNVGMFKFDVVTQSFTLFEKSPENIWRLAFKSQNEILIGTKKGLYNIDLNTKIYTSSSQFKDIWVTDFIINPDQSVWVSSYGEGLFFKSAQKSFTDKFTQYKVDEKSRTGLISNYLLSLYRDKQDIIWIGTDGYGLQRYDDKQRQFGHQKNVENDPSSISHDFVRAILKDTKGNIWIGTRKGLNKTSDNGFERYLHHSDKNQSLSHNNVFSLHEDIIGRVWIGTYGGGLMLYNSKSNDFSRYSVKSHNLLSNRVYAITSDDKGNLWLGSNKGITRFHPDTGNIKHFTTGDNKDNALSNNTIFSLIFDQKANSLWIGTRNGLNFLNLNTEEFRHFNHENDGLTHNMVTSLYLERPNKLWVGTFQGLNVLDISNHKLTSDFNINNLLNQNIFAIKKDSKGSLWLATNKGLLRFNTEHKTVQTFSPSDGIQDNSFTLGASFQSQDGELFFGGIKGFNQFYPDNLNFTTQAPTPVITDLLIYNNPVSLALDKSIKTPIQTSYTASYADNLIFNENHGVIGFSFTGLRSGAAPEYYKYAYRLKGLDDKWIYTTANNRQINYSQLPAGEYQLLLKAADHYEQWSKIEQLIKFSVVPPWWKSTGAYFGYFLIFVVIIWLFLLSRYQIKLAQKESDKQKELHQLKSEFLDNMSHELKTPLSLILAPLESLLTRHTDEISQQNLLIIKRNSKQLLMFIEQLLLMSKGGNAQINIISPYHANPVFEQYFDDFKTLFKQKNITFSYLDETCLPCYLQLEHNHLVSIINNLLSNALKYTHHNGSVTLKLTSTKTMMTLTVSDTGVGIINSDQRKIFERFNRIKTTNETGNGIGLALVKQLVEKYRGKIKLTSELNVGSDFYISLPLVSVPQFNDEINVSAHSLKQFTHSAQQHLKTILIVEDNTDMQTLLVSLFNDEYNCISCSNGEKGLALCRLHVPDLVISDVMMPKFNGYQLLDAIRNDIAINHIPILLLSAKADVQSRIKGLDLLADDYLSKPFEPALLKSRVNALLSVREMLNQHLKLQLGQDAKSLKIDSTMAQSKDYSFTQKLKAVIEEHYHNEAFSVDLLANSLHLSPRALQLKMKAIYNLTPSDYIRNTRLEYAKSLLINTDKSIGFIAEQVGFSSQSYFAKCFKVHYGHSPKQFRDNTKINEYSI